MPHTGNGQPTWLAGNCNRWMDGWSRNRIVLCACVTDRCVTDLSTHLEGFNACPRMSL